MSDFSESGSFQNLPHPRALAFLGDAVYEIFLRELAVQKGLSHSKDLHAFTSSCAKASAQVALLHHLKPRLTEAEQELVRQGRNVGVSAGRRSDQAAHRQATGFETLIGGLHLSNPTRLAQLLAEAKAFLEAEAGTSTE